MSYKNWEDFNKEWGAIEHPEEEWITDFDYATVEERELIQKLSGGDVRRIWTRIQSDGVRDLELLVPGQRLVNRMSYVIAKKPRTKPEHEDLIYILWDHDNECSEDLGGDDE